MESGPVCEMVLGQTSLLSANVQAFLSSDLPVNEVDVQMTLKFVRAGISAVSLYPRWRNVEVNVQSTDWALICLMKIVLPFSVSVFLKFCLHQTFLFYFSRKYRPLTFVEKHSNSFDLPYAFKDLCP